MEFNLDRLVRDNIKKMTPYSSARHEYCGEANIFLDANENAIGSPLKNECFNRYPDPLQLKLKNKISEIKGLPIQNIFLGNGSDDAVDLLFRIFCEPGRDNIIICPPTYGMYEVCAAVNDVKVIKVNLNNDYQLNTEGILKAINPFTRLIFICSPNNPTGNSMKQSDIDILLNKFEGLVIIDEAYINYAAQGTLIPKLMEYPNLVILQTLSKAWGLAGLRLGMAFASGEIIYYLNKVKYPYNINTATQQLALKALNNIETVNDWIKIIVEQREWLKNELLQLPMTQTVYPSDANFLLIKMIDAKKIYDYLAGKGIIVRDRSGCLRITVGTPEENKILIKTLKEYTA